jgi:hypothetical protein
MDNSSPPIDPISAARTTLCEQCAATFIMARSDQRFCSDSCRLRRWRTLRKTARPEPKIDQKYVDQLRSEVTRLAHQVAELRFANDQLRAALAQAAAPAPAGTDIVYQRTAAHRRWQG